MDNEPMKLAIRLTDGHTITLVCEEVKAILQQIYLITNKWQSQQPVCQPCHNMIMWSPAPLTVVSSAIVVCNIPLNALTHAHALLILHFFFLLYSICSCLIGNCSLKMSLAHCSTLHSSICVAMILYRGQQPISYCVLLKNHSNCYQNPNCCQMHKVSEWVSECVATVGGD